MMKPDENMTVGSRRPIARSRGIATRANRRPSVSIGAESDHRLDGCGPARREHGREESDDGNS